MVVSPVVALIALGGDTDSTSVALTAVGLAVTAGGPLLVSSRLAEPNYDVMLVLLLRAARRPGSLDIEVADTPVRLVGSAASPSTS